MKFLPTLQPSKIHIFLIEFFGKLQLTCFFGSTNGVLIFTKFSVKKKKKIIHLTSSAPKEFATCSSSYSEQCFFFYLANVIKRAPAGHGEAAFV